MPEGKQEPRETETMNEELDRLLNGWAEEVFAGMRQQEDVFLGDVFVIADDLGYPWWNRLLDQSQCRLPNISIFPTWPHHRSAV